MSIKVHFVCYAVAFICRYDKQTRQLVVTVMQARNLSAVAVPANCQV